MTGKYIRFWSDHSDDEDICGGHYFEPDDWTTMWPTADCLGGTIISGDAHLELEVEQWKTCVHEGCTERKTKSKRYVVNMEDVEEVPIHFKQS